MGFHVISANSRMDHVMERYRKIGASDLKTFWRVLADLIEVEQLINATSNGWAMLYSLLRTERHHSPRHKFFRQNTMQSTVQDYTPWYLISGRRRQHQTRHGKSSRKPVRKSTTILLNKRRSPVGTSYFIRPTQ